jgi:hypothetical protein
VGRYRYPDSPCFAYGLRKHKEFADALRMELAALDHGDHRGMRKVAASLIKEALRATSPRRRRLQIVSMVRCPFSRWSPVMREGEPVRSPEDG